jgi:hypothetical protein
MEKLQRKIGFESKLFENKLKELKKKDLILDQLKDEIRSKRKNIDKN